MRYPMNGGNEYGCMVRFGDFSLYMETEFVPFIFMTFCTVKIGVLTPGNDRVVFKYSNFVNIKISSMVVILFFSVACLQHILTLQVHA